MHKNRETGQCFPMNDNAKLNMILMVWLPLDSIDVTLTVQLRIQTFIKNTTVIIERHWVLGGFLQPLW